MLQKTFFELIENYSNNQFLKQELWKEIEQNYSSNKRYYHTLNHLENLLNQLLEIKYEIENWNCILFTLFYHDVIYKVTKSNNEEISADFALKKMLQLSVPTSVIESCNNQILSTKNHLLNENTDTNFFLDADLSVLGQDWNVYSKYYQNVRKEYSIYPEILYKLGRKKVLKHFLAMEKIFKTDYFYQKFEKNARMNLQREFDL